MTTADISAIRTTFHAIQDDLSAAYVEREAAIECLILAALSGQNAFLIGRPGTGKSALFGSFLAHFQGARTFSTLVTKFTTEDALFGPVKLSALKQDRYERATDGRLADVHAAFVDELFKASDAALNTMLTAINERTYMGRKIPLRFTAAASNELPTDDGLAAVYDRFVCREVVEYVQDSGVWSALISSPPSYAPAMFLSLVEWETAVSDVARVTLPRETVAALVKIRDELSQVGIVASDRRWIALTRVLRAAAWLDGRTVVTLDDLRVLRYGLWTKPEDREKVSAILEAFDQGPARAALKIIDEALSVYHAHKRKDVGAQNAARAGVVATLTKAIQAVQEVTAGGVSTRAAEQIGRRGAELDAAYDELSQAVAKAIGTGLGAFSARGRSARS